jgi:hypothetical protein
MRVPADAIIDLLRKLPARGVARRMVSVIPFGSIYWEDEMPDYLDLAKVSVDERNTIWRLLPSGSRYGTAKHFRLTIKHSGTPHAPMCRPGHYSESRIFR